MRQVTNKPEAVAEELQPSEEMQSRLQAEPVEQELKLIRSLADRPYLKEAAVAVARP
jgi:hypothetical protein